MKYLASKRRQLTGLGMGKDTKQMVSFLVDRGFSFKSFSVFIRDICRYLHDNGKVDKCPFMKQVDSTGVNASQCLCSSCYGWRRVLCNESPSHLANKLYGMFLEVKTAQSHNGSINDGAFLREMLRGTEASLNRLIACTTTCVSSTDSAE